MTTTPLTRAVARLLLPASAVTAAALLVKGYADVGDGFSAGVVAATGVLLQYLAYGAARAERWLPVRHAPAIAVLGLAIALAVAGAPLLGGRPILHHVPAPGADVTHLGRLELHTAVLFDVGVFLLVVGFLVTVMRAVAARTPQDDR